MIAQFGQGVIVYLGLKIIGVESRYSGACDYVLMWRSWSARYARLFFGFSNALIGWSSRGVPGGGMENFRGFDRRVYSQTLFFLAHG